MRGGDGKTVIINCPVVKVCLPDLPRFTPLLRRIWQKPDFGGLIYNHDFVGSPPQRRPLIRHEKSPMSQRSRPYPRRKGCVPCPSRISGISSRILQEIYRACQEPYGSGLVCAQLSWNSHSTQNPLDPRVLDQGALRCGNKSLPCLKAYRRRSPGKKNGVTLDRKQRANG
jgi:hypothetical protein